MESNHIYSESLIWILTDFVNVSAYHIYPVLLVLVALIWLLKTKSKVSIVALLGSLFVLSAKVMHLTVGEVSSVALSSPVPNVDQNVLVWFLFLHGRNIGLLIFSSALCWYFSRAKSV